MSPEPTPGPPAPEPPAKSVSVSLWHKIFGGPAPKPVETSGEDHIVEEISPAAEFESTMEELVEHTWDASDDAVEGEFVTAADEGTEIGEAPSTEQKQRRPRRRRGRARKSEERTETRRGGGRPRRADVMETPGADDFGDFDELSDEQDREEDQFGEEPLGDDEADEEGVAAGDSRARSKLAGHRSIPSWDEAIGMIVDANMQTRTQRRPSRDSGGRGRPRGGRRRRRPS